jgi:hypothetical protein
VNGKTPIYLTAIAAAIMAAAVFLVQPYSVRSPWTAYSGPARRYLRTALDRDSLALVRQSAGAGSVTWALAVGRRHSKHLQPGLSIRRPRAPCTGGTGIGHVLPAMRRE